MPGHYCACPTQKGAYQLQNTKIHSSHRIAFLRKKASHYSTPCGELIDPFFRSICEVTRTHFPGTVELVYSGHPSEAAKWLLYKGGLLIEVFNVHVEHGKFLRTDRLTQGDRPSQVTVNTGSTVYTLNYNMCT